MIKSIVVFLCIICILLGSTYNKEHFLYRLGDMVRLDHKEWGRSNSKIGYVMYKKKYPYSIAKKYMDRTKKINNYSVLLQILNEYTPKVTCDNCLIIHLRIGDVLDNSDYSVSDHLKRPIPHKNKLMYVKPLSYYIKTIKIAKKKKIRNIILIGGYHTNTTHTKSDLYVDTIEKLFRNNNFISNAFKEIFSVRSSGEDFIYYILFQISKISLLFVHCCLAWWQISKISLLFVHCLAWRLT